MEQNVHRKFNDRQNQVRLYVLEFTVNEGRAFNLEADKEGALKELAMTEQHSHFIRILKSIPYLRYPANRSL